MPHRSEPATRARTGPARSATVALAVDHGAAQAREVTLELARALIEQDESALLGLLSRRVVVVMKADVQSSKEVAERCLAGARNLSFEPGLTARDLAEPDELQVELAEVFHADSTLPSGVDARDLAVSVSRSARRGPRNLPCLARLYVRPGPHPRVVGISR